MKKALAALVLASCVVAHAAHAAPPEDVVTVKDGTVWRGRITELVGGDHVTLRMEDGKEARIRWDAIARLDRAAAPPSALPPTEHGGPPVRVVVIAEREVILERVHPSAPRASRYETVCLAPCNREVPAGLPYRVAGPGMRSSGSFTVSGEPGDTVRVTVDDASTSGFVGGIVMTSLGGASALVGGILLALGAAGAGDVNARNSDGFAVAGGVTLGVGLGLLIPGIVLLSNNSSTKVEVDLPRRSPNWTKPTAPEGLPISVSLPIAGGAF